MNNDLTRSICLEVRDRNVIKAEKGIGSFILLDFGESQSAAYSGSIRLVKLWVYLCDWRLTQDSKLLATSDAINESNASVLESLVGRRVDSLEPNENAGNLYINFDKNLTLALLDSPDVYGPGADMLMVYFGDGHAGSYQAGKGFQA